MAILEQTISLKNSCSLITKAIDTFSPIKEAITNSLDAIAQRGQSTKDALTSEIFVSIYFKTEKDMYEHEINSLEFITIEDNGIGFTSDNVTRFKELASDTKGLNNRGTGKIQIFHRFNTITINSVFLENRKWQEFNASWNINGEYDSKLEEIKSQKETKTVVKISDFSGGKKEEEYFLRYIGNINELKREILKHFLLRLWLGNVEKHLNLTIKIFINNIKQDEYIFNHKNIPTPDKTEPIEINTEQAKIIVNENDNRKTKIEWILAERKHELKIHRFKIPSDDIHENSIYLCSKDIVVEQFKFYAIKRKDAVFDGYRYLSSINGDILDKPESVNQAVDKFMFPFKKDIEAEFKDESFPLFNQENIFIFRDEVNSQINNGLAKVYNDVEGLKEKQREEIVALAMQYGISLEDADEAPIQFNDSQEEATEKLFETQAKRLAKESIEIQKTYQELKDLETKKLNPISDQYKQKFGELSNKLLEKIPQQNKDELARYIIRRDMVVDLLKLALSRDLAIQKEWAKKKANGEKVHQDNEGLIHDIIFRRRMKGVPNDLWILNEEFVHFDGCSDMELEKLEINGEKILQDNVDMITILNALGIQKETYSKMRPDIFLFPEEGKCILVEFKAPDVELSLYCDQILRYANILANFAKIQFKQFFGFLIGENVDKLFMPGRFKLVPYGNYRVNPNEPINDIKTGLPKADLYQEIIPLSEIAKRAAIRNKSFADKLGITQNDLKKLKKKNENK